MIKKIFKILVKTMFQKSETIYFSYQVVIVQWLARQLAPGEVLGSNPGKGENL